MKKIYVIYRGQGDDGGFGDYVPCWENTPLTLRGETLWFNHKETAERVTKDLNELSQKEFYKSGLGDSYDGKFPIEYESRALIIPDNSPRDYESFQEILNQEFDSWNWFTANCETREVDEGVIKAHPNLLSCKECGNFGYSKLQIDRTTGICLYCETDEEYYQNDH